MARPRDLPSLRAPRAGLAARLVRARPQRAHRAGLGDYVSGAIAELAEVDAHLAPLLVPHPALAMFAFDLPPIMAVVVVVVDLAMLRRVLGRVGMVGRALSHGRLLSFAESSVA